MAKDLTVTPRMRQPNLRRETMPQRVAERAIELYARAAADWSQAPFVLSRGLRGARELHSHDRRAVMEAVYSMIRWRRRLAFLVTGQDEAAPDLLYRALGETLDASRLETIADPIARLAIAESVPDWLARRLADELGLEETTKLLAAMNRRAPLMARANTLRNTRGELAQALRAEKITTRPHPLASDGLELDTHVNAYGLKAFKEGRFELQDAGSQLIAELCAPPPRGTIIDACAGAGGKTLALGALAQNKGRIVALDVSEKKLEELRERARRAGLTNVQALTVGDTAPANLVGRGDRVLCDAPCSGVGVLRRNPEARWRLQPSDLDELPARQRAILETYAPLVKEGGRLIYATCTVGRAENDAVVEAFLAAHPSFREVSAREILGSDRAVRIGDGTRLRMLPHVHDTDGFFAAVMRRVS
jgi:16S rRNA (cytosine967-C5)-methyltransferase